MVICFEFLKLFLFSLLVAMCDLVHDVETRFQRRELLTTSGNIF